MNKNTRKLKRQLRLAARRGETTLTVQVPVRNYHSVRTLTSKTLSVSVGLVSRNTRRNMQQRVLSNSGGGSGSSLTVHEPIDKEKPIGFKNHKYVREDKHLGYRQPYEKPA